MSDTLGRDNGNGWCLLGGVSKYHAGPHVLNPPLAWSKCLRWRFVPHLNRPPLGTAVNATGRDSA